MNIYNNAIYSIASAIAHRKAPGAIIKSKVHFFSINSNPPNMEKVKKYH
jgi:hypothetical protein